MNIHDLPYQDRTVAIEAEQSVLGALLLDNDALDKISDLSAEHFYRADHRVIFEEIAAQIAGGKTADVISVGLALAERVEACLPYLNEIAQNTPSAANIRHYARIVSDRAVKRAIVSLGSEAQELASTSTEEAGVLVDQIATKIDALAQKKVRSDPIRMSDMLASYADLLEARMAGVNRAISTGFKDLDRRLGGGLARGTLTVIAGRPAMGKTAMGMAIARNVSTGGSVLFLSMEMAKDLVNDRNIAALGQLPISWLEHPDENDKLNWDRLTNAYRKSAEMDIYIDDETALNMLDIKNKARQVKRRKGLDLLVIDQLSFITGGSKDKKTYELIGEYTRGLIALAKQMDIPIVLLAQLNRECENRTNKRPQLSDLAISGSIEQDASIVIFLYRDEIYNPDSQDRGVCEVHVAKHRQGSPGVVALTYIAEQTRFEDYHRAWEPPKMKSPAKSRGLE
jgi:replicative DNA helicase